MSCNGKVHNKRQAVINAQGVEVGEALATLGQGQDVGHWFCPEWFKCGKGEETKPRGPMIWVAIPNPHRWQQFCTEASLVQIQSTFYSRLKRGFSPALSAFVDVAQRGRAASEGRVAVESSHRQNCFKGHGASTSERWGRADVAQR